VKSEGEIVQAVPRSLPRLSLSSGLSGEASSFMSRLPEGRLEPRGFSSLLGIDPFLLTGPECSVYQGRPIPSRSPYRSLIESSMFETHLATPPLRGELDFYVAFASQTRPFHVSNNDRSPQNPPDSPPGLVVDSLYFPAVSFFM